MKLKQKILKATLMLRKLGNKYQTKEEQIAEFTEWYTAEKEADLDEWIDGLREELAKTPEQREEESLQFIEELSQREWELAQQEMAAMRHERDEWDDLWDDRARSVGAIRF
jgi:hypothetical protein